MRRLRTMFWSVFTTVLLLFQNNFEKSEKNPYTAHCYRTAPITEMGAFLQVGNPTINVVLFNSNFSYLLTRSISKSVWNWWKMHVIDHILISTNSIQTRVIAQAFLNGKCIGRFCRINCPNYQEFKNRQVRLWSETCLNRPLDTCLQNWNSYTV